MDLCTPFDASGHGRTDFLAPFYASGHDRDEAIEFPPIAGADWPERGYFKFVADFERGACAQVYCVMPPSAVPKLIEDAWAAYKKLNEAGLFIPSVLDARATFTAQLEQYFRSVDPESLCLRLTGENPDVENWQTAVYGVHPALPRPVHAIIIYLKADGFLHALCGNYGWHMDSEIGPIDSLLLNSVGSHDPRNRRWLSYPEDEALMNNPRNFIKGIWAAPSLGVPAEVPEPPPHYGTDETGARNAMYVEQVYRANQVDLFLIERQTEIMS